MNSKWLFDSAAATSPMSDDYTNFSRVSACNLLGDASGSGCEIMLAMPSNVLRNPPEKLSGLIADLRRPVEERGPDARLESRRKFDAWHKSSSREIEERSPVKRISHRTAGGRCRFGASHREGRLMRLVRLGYEARPDRAQP